MTAFINICAANPDMEKYKPPFEDVDDDQKRCIILHSSISVQMGLKSGSLPDRQRLAMNMQLADFVRGSTFSILPAPDPPKPPNSAWSDIRGLIGYDQILWEMKFRGPPQHRIIGIVPAKDFFVGFKIIPRDKMDWKTECKEILANYYALLKPNPCTAIKSHNATEAFSKWRFPS